MSNPVLPSRVSGPRDERELLFPGAGEMKGRCRRFDWASNALGPVEQWPQSLRTIVTTILDSGFPNIVLWGPGLIQIYNDGYREIMGAKHPAGLGMRTQECWPEAWEFNRPIYERVFQGRSEAFEDVLIPIRRYGALEDTYFTISYSPIRDEAHAVGGVLVTLLETTARVAARRLESVREKLLRQVQLERNRLDEIFRQSPGFFTVLRGTNYVFERANSAYFQLVGHRDIIGKPVALALPEVVEQGFIGLLDNVRDTGTPFVGQEMPVMLARTPGATPEQVYVNFVYQAIYDEDGAYSGIVAQGTDVSDQVRARREAERLLRESEQSRQDLVTLYEELRLTEQRLEDVFEQAPMAVAVLSGPEHVYTVASPMYTRYLGGRPLLGRAFREAVPETGGQRVALIMDEVYQTGKAIQKKEQIVPLDRDGDGVLEDYIFDISYQPLRSRDGEVYAITSLSLDVTEQVRARRLSEEATRAIEHAREQLGRVFSQAPVAIAVLEGAEHRFTLANERYEALIGHSAFVGRTVREVFPELSGSGIYETLDGVFNSGKPFVGEEVALPIRKRPDAEPEETIFNFVYHPLVTADGTVYGIAAVAVDVTTQVVSRRLTEKLLKDSEASREELEHLNRQLQDSAAELEAQATEMEAQTEELAEQTRQAQEANKAKGEFLATMSHELRTPLNAIAGYADLLLSNVRGEMTAPQRLDVERMQRSGQHLLGLINSLLNFTKIDSGEIDYDIKPWTLQEMLHGLPDLIAPQLGAKSLHLNVELCNVETRVLGDDDKVRQILLNLLTNALKFTDEGGTITLSCESDETRARIRVRDSGRGIAPENHQRIFNPFVQLDRHLTPQKQQGIGLGLAISRDLARAMNGNLEVESDVGAGSVFTLSLPRAV